MITSKYLWENIYSSSISWKYKSYVFDMHTPQEITQVLPTETKGKKKKKQQLGIDIRGGGGEDF